MLLLPELFSAPSPSTASAPGSVAGPGARSMWHACRCHESSSSSGRHVSTPLPAAGEGVESTRWRKHLQGTWGPHAAGLRHVRCGQAGRGSCCRCAGRRQPGRVAGMRQQSSPTPSSSQQCLAPKTCARSAVRAKQGYSLWGYFRQRWPEHGSHGIKHIRLLPGRAAVHQRHGEHRAVALGPLLTALRWAGAGGAWGAETW